jgi:hypothetical protein
VKSCFIVQGSTGEYSDHCEWISCVFLTRESAEALATKLNQWALENKCHTQNKRGIDFAGYDEREKLTEDLKRLDPGAKREVALGTWSYSVGRIDYTGVDWTVYEATLEEI